MAATYCFSTAVGFIKARRIRFHRIQLTVPLLGKDCNADSECGNEEYFCAEKTPCENSQICAFSVGFWSSLVSRTGECRDKEDLNKPVCSISEPWVCRNGFCGFLGSPTSDQGKATVCYEQKAQGGKCFSDQGCNKGHFCAKKTACAGNKICSIATEWDDNATPTEGGESGMCRRLEDRGRTVCSSEGVCGGDYFCGALLEGKFPIALPLITDKEATTDPVCYEKKAAYQPCSHDSECQDGYFCAHNKPCDGNKICPFVRVGDKNQGMCRPEIDKNKTLCRSQEDCDMKKFFCGRFDLTPKPTDKTRNPEYKINGTTAIAATASDAEADTLILCYPKKPTRIFCSSDLECFKDDFCGFGKRGKEMSINFQTGILGNCSPKKYFKEICYDPVECQDNVCECQGSSIWGNFTCQLK